MDLNTIVTLNDMIAIVQLFLLILINHKLSKR